MKLLKYKFALFPLLFAFLLGACGSEGIDRFDGDINQISDDITTLGGVPNTPNRFVQLEKLQFEANLPSIITVMFQATDQFDGPISGLQTSDFALLEDDLPVSTAETSLSIVPREELPFSLRTVIMIDISSSITPTDLDQIKAAVLGLIIDAQGASQLLPEQEIALYSFDDNVRLLQDFTGNPESLISAIENIQPAVAITPTDFYGAVITAASRVEDNIDTTQITKGNAIIITDGTDTAARNTRSEAISAVQNKSVFTLGIGDEISAEALQEIGTSGTFALRNFGQLNSVLTSINQQVVDQANSFYYLHYASPKRGSETGNSIHDIRLLVTNNANNGSSSEITDSFDATDFSNVQAEVIISGPRRIELDQSGILSATTRWGPQTPSNFIWSLPEDNATCQIDRLTATSIRLTGVATGNCTVTAEDQSAGGVQGWFSVDVFTNN